MLSAGAIAVASCSASGSAACPGPPASAITALALCAVPEALRSTVSDNVPAALPLRSSGTVTGAHENAVFSGQGEYVSTAEAEPAPTEASAAAASGAASNIVSVRRGIARTLPAGMVGSAGWKVDEHDVQLPAPAGVQPGSR